MLDLLILKNLHTGFHNSYANFYSHQLRIMVPIHTFSPTVLVRPFDDHYSDGGSPFPDNQGCDTLRNTGTCVSFSRNCLFISLAQVLIESFIFLVFHIFRVFACFVFVISGEQLPARARAAKDFYPFYGWLALLMVSFAGQVFLIVTQLCLISRLVPRLLEFHSETSSWTFMLKNAPYLFPSNYSASVLNSICSTQS